MLSRRVARFWLLLTAGLIACAALFVPRWSGLPLAPESVASQSFSSALVPKTVPLRALQAAVSEDRFRALVGGEVEVLEEGFDQFRLTARHPQAEVSRARVQQSVSLLSAELERLALSEIEANKEHLQKLESDVSKRLSSAGKGGSLDLIALPEKDAKRILRLRKEIPPLSNFVRGGARPSWVGPVLERASLERQEKKLKASKAELNRLSLIWAPGSKPLQAQIKLVQREKAELLSLERHLAGVLLDSHQLELKSLEEKSHSIVRQNSDRLAKDSPSAQAEATPPAGLTESARWLKEKSRELESQAARMETLAQLVPHGEMVVTPAKPLGRWISGGLWLLALGFLLWALFLPEPAPYRRPRSSAARAPAAAPVRPPAAPPVSLVRDEVFQELLLRIQGELGRPPRRLMVLALESSERSGFTLRLARSISNSGLSVKLLDFDFQRRELSLRIHGGSSQPGVSDLLTYGGAAEEFFASFPETRIQFAPAGTVARLGDNVDPMLVQRLLVNPAAGGMTLIDADFTSPLHLVAGSVDAVLLLSPQSRTLSKSQEEVLLALRESRLPIWGIAQGSSSVFPYI